MNQQETSNSLPAYSDRKQTTFTVSTYSNWVEGDSEFSSLFTRDKQLRVLPSGKPVYKVKAEFNNIEEAYALFHKLRERRIPVFRNFLSR